MIIETKLKVGRYRVPVKLDYQDKYIYVYSPYNKNLISEIKILEGAHWCGYDKPTPKKVWRIDNSTHNNFRLQYMQGVKVYERYDAEIISNEYDRPLFTSQREAADFMLTRKQLILAGEMGCVSGSAYVYVRRGVRKNIQCMKLSNMYKMFHTDQRDYGHEIKTFIRSTHGNKFVYPQVLNVLKKEPQATLHLTTATGLELEVTPDHEVSYEFNDFKRADQLKVGDVIRICVYGENGIKPFFDTIINIKEQRRRQHVYDVVCDEPYRHFLANDIVVHNCGKTLASIEVMERSGNPNWWFVAPRSALRGVTVEFRKWNCKIQPNMMTYDGMVSEYKKFIPDSKIPYGIIFDESSRLKSPTSQRSIAAENIADMVRDYWGKNAHIILMSGTPAPKNPADWYQQVKVACPGYLKEGDYYKFRQRLALTEKRENAFGQAYPNIVTWLNDEKKCAVCGQYAEDHVYDDHNFVPSENEVYKLSQRMEGLVLVQFKKDIMDLPDKFYKRIKLQPTQKTIDIADALLSSAKTVASGLILLRELSDGFQYVEKEVGKETCPVCNGKCKIPNPLLNSDLPEDSRPNEIDLQNQPETVDCDGCGGKGTRKVYQRTTKQITTPKEEALRDLLDEYIEVGRVVIYGSFTGSIDRIVSICESNGWDWIRADGRGWHSNLSGDPLENFQEKMEKHPRVAFIGQPGAAGMGITLTASPVIIYFSNDFNAESRIQSEDRIHRPGMDLNRGATIIDIIHLPTDELVLNNLQQKRELQALSLGEVTATLKGKDYATETE